MSRRPVQLSVQSSCPVQSRRSGFGLFVPCRARRLLFQASGFKLARPSYHVSIVNLSRAAFVQLSVPGAGLPRASGPGQDRNYRLSAPVSVLVRSSNRRQLYQPYAAAGCRRAACCSSGTPSRTVPSVARPSSGCSVRRRAPSASSAIRLVINSFAVKPSDARPASFFYFIFVQAAVFRPAVLLVRLPSSWLALLFCCPGAAVLLLSSFAFFFFCCPVRAGWLLSALADLLFICHLPSGRQASSSGQARRRRLAQHQTGICQDRACYLYFELSRPTVRLSNFWAFAVCWPFLPVFVCRPAVVYHIQCCIC